MPNTDWARGGTGYFNKSMPRKRKSSKAGRSHDNLAAGIFVRDYTVQEFSATCFYIGPRKAIYEMECLELNVFPKIRSVFQDHGFSAIDPRKVLAAVIGNSQREGVQWKGPIYYPPEKGYPPTYDFHGLFMQQDRKLLISLIEAIFSLKDHVARNSTVIPLRCHLESVKFDPRIAFRQAVIHFIADSPGDRMRVTVQGEKDEPNTFTFEHTMNWITNRYLQPNAITWAAPPNENCIS